MRPQLLPQRAQAGARSPAKREPDQQSKANQDAGKLHLRVFKAQRTKVMYSPDFAQWKCEVLPGSDDAAGRIGLYLITIESIARPI